MKVVYLGFRNLGYWTVIRGYFRAGGSIQSSLFCPFFLLIMVNLFKYAYRLNLHAIFYSQLEK